MIRLGSILFATAPPLLAVWAVALCPAPVDAHPAHDHAAIADDGSVRRAHRLEQRLQARPLDAVTAKQLGDLYLRVAREQGVTSYYDRAAAVLERSDEILPDNAPTLASLAQAYAAQHRFEEALAAARRARSRDPRHAGALAAEGDALLALGFYDEAADVYRELHELAPGAPVLARLAELRHLHGDDDGARELLERAETAGEDDAAWYRFRQATLSLTRGDTARAVQEFRGSLELRPGWNAARIGLGRALAATGNLREAEVLLTTAAKEAPEPAGLIALGDVRSALGNHGEAAACYFEAGRLVARHPGLHDRPYILHLSNSGDPERAVEMARRDLERRRDVYGHDALAWALLRAGRPAEARAAMDRALRLGTIDPLLDYHSGMIDAALGRTVGARHALERALGRSPLFHPTQAAVAAETLERLR